MFTESNQKTNFQKIDWLHTQAVNKHKQGEIEEAIAFYLESIEVDKNQPAWIYGNVITLLAQVERLDEGLELGEKALKIYPESDELYRAIAILLENKLDLIKSIKYYQKAVSLNDQQPNWVYQKLVDSLQSVSLENRQKGNIKEAIQFSQQANQLILQKPIHPEIEDIERLETVTPTKSASVSTKPKIAVVSWDLGHNPAGRSFLLADMANLDYDVELIGPLFSFYGKELWGPLKNIDFTIKSFPVNNFQDFVEGSKKLASQRKYDFVYISKPRFPSLFIGMLIKYYSKCPLILDIDDHELSFFPNQNKASFSELIEREHNSEWYNLYSEIWTRFAEELIPHADAITVSNLALQRKYGGIVVRHGRNEKFFNPKLYSRENIRKQFGYTDNDKVILFLGTPRPHKGIFQIADALEKINDPRLVLCIIGTINDKRVSQKFSKYQKARIDFHENQPWEKLAELISLADLICILQDKNSPISDYQIPAKLTDALAMNIPTVVTQVPPFLDLIATKSVISITDEDDSLEQIFKQFVTSPEELISEYISPRNVFLTEFSYQVNSARIKQAVQIAADETKPLPNLFFDVVKLITEEAKIEFFPDGENKKSNRKSQRENPSVIIKKDEPFNILFFWKQNDSDIYGRRQDMIVKYLAKSDRINKIIHFDAPISSTKLQSTLENGVKAKFSQNNLVFANTVQRFLGLKDTSKIIKKTFIYRENDAEQLFLGRSLPTKDEYPDFVKQVIQESDISRNTIAWVCPVNFEFPLLHKELNFSFVVADIIDDQRKWDVHPKYLIRLEENYQQILKQANVILTNCEPLKDSFLELNKTITIVPNGSEVFEKTRVWTKPENLENIQKPIIGYVGNLSDRIDIELLKYIATTNKNWNIVLVGSAHRNAQIFELAEFENIHLLGVKPYDEALAYIKHFDVAIIPHLNNKLTKNMNPLKLYVYFSAGVPIVCSEIANIEEFSGNISIANNPQDFVKCIHQALNSKNISIDNEKRNSLLQKIDWRSRVDKILDTLEAHLCNHSFSSESNNFHFVEKSQDKELESVKSFAQTKESNTDDKKLRESSSNKASVSKEKFSYDGICQLCGTKQTFIKKHSSYREGYECSNCKASLRYREQANAILKLFGKTKYSFFSDLCKDEEFKKLSIYEPGVIGPFRKYFANFNNYTKSYFWSDVPVGNYQDGIQCQNLEKLTYDSDRFDLVITSEMMKHIRRPWDAFKEIWRVLKPGGSHIFSIPIDMPMKEKTLYRVDTSGDRDIHLEKPLYHSVSQPNGERQESLVYVEFGQDIVEKLANIGYQIDLLSPNYQENCDIHQLITFVAKKPK